jgi:hypothetical protein
MGIACGVIVLAGFAPTWFLRSLLARTEPLTPLLHVHAALFTAWLGLFVTQAALMRSDRRALHMQLGKFAALLAIAMIGAGVFVAIEGAAGRGPGEPAVPADARLFWPLLRLVVVAAFIGAGIYFRRDGNVHKRTMLLATIFMMGPAIARIGRHAHLADLGLSMPTTLLIAGLALLAAAMIHDLVTRRRIHRAYVLGAALMLATTPGSPLLAFATRTRVWHELAQWLMS